MSFCAILGSPTQSPCWSPPTVMTTLIDDKLQWTELETDRPSDNKMIRLAQFTGHFCRALFTSIRFRCCYIPFCLVVDAPFVVYWLLTTFVLVAAMATYSKRVSRSRQVVAMALAGFVLYANFSVFSIFEQFEVVPDEISYHYNMSAVDPTSSFFRMDEPVLDYNNAIRKLMGKMNGKAGKRSAKLEQLPIQNATVWSSDPLRFDFLEQYWNNDNMTSKWACIIESDMMVDVGHFKRFLDARGGEFEFAMVQSFQGRRNFESINIGVLCSTKQPSMHTRLWSRFIRNMQGRRIRRLVPMPLLYGMFSPKVILEWEVHGGCTQYRPHCNYVHFATPKRYFMCQALKKFEDTVSEELNFCHPWGIVN